MQSADAIARGTRTDLYLGVVAPVGIRRDSFQAALERALEPYGYSTEVLRLSVLLRDFQGVTIDERTEYDRLVTAMDAGSWLREEIAADVLARQAMNKVHGARSPGEREPRAYVFWSLKHPEEVATLRLVYGDSFHLIGLFASEEDRVHELMQRPGISEQDARDLVKRDREEEGRKQGQQTRDTFHRADVFLRWAHHPDECALERFLRVLFGCPSVTPTLDEHRMFLAFAGALRSGELSRQVGATLVSASGDVLAVGANDVPRRGGGLYWPTDDDDRDVVRGVDANVSVRRELLLEVAREISPDLGGADAGAIAEKLERTRLKEITEYGRAVHAEMEALLACGRSGHSSLGTTLYVTTYPCHNCARHLIAAGVRRVVFVEPYPKSRALELHDQDVVEVAPGHAAKEGEQTRVCFEPYLGVGPRRFFDYFSMGLGGSYDLVRRDSGGRLIEWSPSQAAPRGQLPVLNVMEREAQLGGEVLDFLGRGEEASQDPAR